MTAETVAVASNVIAQAAAETPAKVPVDTEGVVSAVQLKLRSLGYVDVGKKDGEASKRTQAAILDFRNRNNLPSGTSIDGDLLIALANAQPKPVPVEQATATAATIAPHVEAVKQTRWTKFWAKVMAYPALLVSGALAIADRFDDAVNKLSPLKNMVNEVPGWVWIGGVGLLATLLALSVNKSENAIVDAYQKGTTSDDNKEASP